MSEQDAQWVGVSWPARQAMIVLSAVLAYERTVGLVVTDLRPIPEYREVLDHLLRAKLTLQHAIAEAQPEGSEERS